MKLLYFFLMLFLCMSARAQEIIFPDLRLKPLPFSMFWNSKSLFNPAASGIEYKYYAALMGKEQWAGIKNAPGNIGSLMTVKSDFLHGAAGISYIYTGVSECKMHDLYINYAFHINLGNERLLSTGISGGSTLMKCDFEDWPLIEDKGTATFYDFQLGLFYRSDHLQLGLSSNLFDHREMNSSEKDISNNIYIYSAYRFDIGEFLDISPEVLLLLPEFLTDDLTLSSGFLFTVRDKFWTGFTYKTDDTYGGMAGIDIAKIVRLGYLFEIRTKVTEANNYGNHEVLVALKIK